MADLDTVPVTISWGTLREDIQDRLCYKMKDNEAAGMDHARRMVR